MTDTLTYRGSLTQVRCWCGMAHAVPEELADLQQRQHANGEPNVRTIYCPLGHQHLPAGEGKAARLERRLKAEADERARVAAERDQARASAAAHKGAATKARKKAAAAVCPVPGCGRSFKQLRRHMSTQHPDFDPANPTAEVPQ